MQTKGFTLVELLVAMSIFIVLAGFVLANFIAGNHEEELRQSAALVENAVRQAQGRALSGFRVDGSAVDGHGITVAFGNGSFVLYADQNNNTEFDSGEELQTVNILDEVAFATTLDVLFDIPTATVYAGGAQASGATVITLTHPTISRSIDITILPFSGQVSVGDAY